MTGRDAVLARIRAGLSDRPSAPTVDRSYRRAGELDSTSVLDLFTERVRDYRAAVVVTADPAAAVAETLAAANVGRVGVAPDLGHHYRPVGVEFVEDDGLSSLELDALDGALTTCAAACAETGTVALDGGPGQGRRALSLVPDLHVCIVRPTRSSRRCPS